MKLTKRKQGKESKRLFLGWSYGKQLLHLHMSVLLMKWKRFALKVGQKRQENDDTFSEHINGSFYASRKK